MTIRQARRKRIEGSLITKVQQFFADNPGEELTYADMDAKFGLSKRRLYSIIGTLKAEGRVEVVHVVKGLPVGGNE